MGQKIFQTHHHREDTRHHFIDVQKEESHTVSFNLPTGEQLTVTVFPNHNCYFTDIHQYDRDGRMKDINGGVYTGMDYGKLEGGRFTETNRVTLFSYEKKKKFKVEIKEIDATHHTFEVEAHSVIEARGLAREMTEEKYDEAEVASVVEI